MSIEHLRVQLKPLKEAVRILGYEWLLTDYDDSIADMSYGFDTSLKIYSSYIANVAQVDPEIVLSFMAECIDGLRPQFSVDPALMTEAARLTALRYSNNFYSPATQAELEKLMDVYNSVPELFEGTKEALNLIGDTGMGLATLTHQKPKWADIKIRGAGIYFHKVFTVPTHETKNEQWWKYAIKNLGVPPQAILVTGDSWKSDIESALEAGIPASNILRIKTAYNISNQGKIEGIREINSFAEVPQVLLELSQQKLRFRSGNRLQQSQE